MTSRAGFILTLVLLQKLVTVFPIVSHLTKVPSPEILMGTFSAMVKGISVNATDIFGLPLFHQTSPRLTFDTFGNGNETVIGDSGWMLPAELPSPLSITFYAENGASDLQLWYFFMKRQFNNSYIPISENVNQSLPSGLESSDSETDAEFQPDLKSKITDNYESSLVNDEF